MGVVTYTAELLNVTIVEDSSFVLIVKSLVAIITPSSSPLILAVVVSFETVAISVESSVIFTPPSSAFTIVELSYVLI